MAETLTHNQEFATPQDALAHYGVKGMKWGVRKDDTGSGKVGMTDDEALLTAYAVAIGGFLIARARFRYVDSGRRDARKLSKDHEWKRDDSLTGPKSIEELHSKVVGPINKGYPSERGTSMNCRRCTFAYELRRRGYDVKATRTIMATGQDSSGVIQATSPKSKDGPTPKVKHDSMWGKNIIPTSVNGAPMTPEGKANAIFDRLSREPEGSRGELAFGWTLGGGHSIAYEVVNRKPVIFDTQSNRMWAHPSAFGREVTPIMNDAAFTRLDNVKVNDQFLKRWVTDNA